MGNNYPPNCRCGGRIVTSTDPKLADHDGDNPPGFIHLKGRCEDCGKVHNLQYVFDECQCDECMEPSEECTGTKSGCKPGTKA